MTIGLILILNLIIVVVCSVAIALGAASFDITWGRKIVTTIGANMGKIWMAGAVVAVLMVLAGVGFGIIHASGPVFHCCD